LLNFSLNPVEIPVTAFKEMAEFWVSPMYLPRVMANHLPPLSGTAARASVGMTP
jgi:hypothetical protein